MPHASWGVCLETGWVADLCAVGGWLTCVRCGARMRCSVLCCVVQPCLVPSCLVLSCLVLCRVFAVPRWPGLLVLVPRLVCWCWCHAWPAGGATPGLPVLVPRLTCWCWCHAWPAGAGAGATPRRVLCAEVGCAGTAGPVCSGLVLVPCLACSGGLSHEGWRALHGLHGEWGVLHEPAGGGLCGP